MGTHHKLIWPVCCLVWLVAGHLSFGADYKQCITLDVQKPSNVLRTDNATSIYLNKTMYSLRTGDLFSVTVTSKCEVAGGGELYVTVDIDNGTKVTRYYHYRDNNNNQQPFSSVSLTPTKRTFYDSFKKGDSVTVWSFPLDDSLKFERSLIFGAYLLDGTKLIGFDEKPVQMNIEKLIEP